MLETRLTHPERFTKERTFKSDLYVIPKSKDLGIVALAEIVESLYLSQEVLNNDGKPASKTQIGYEIAFFKEISMVNMGIMKKNNPEYHSSVQGNLFDEFIKNDDIIKYRYISIKDFSNLKIKNEDLDFIEIDQESSLRDVFDSKSKILISRIINYGDRLEVVYTEEKIAFGYNIIGIVINRPIILPKYVATLLSSRFYYHKYFLVKAKGATISNISLSDIYNLEIPVLPIEQQRVFELIFDYVSNSEPQSKIALFFERIMDAMVYEIFFVEQFLDFDMKISSYASLLVELDDCDEAKKARIIKDLYDVFSSPEHQLGADLLKLMNIPSVRKIENNFESLWQRE